MLIIRIMTLDINTSDISGITDISWVNFDQERFSVGYNGGGIGTITSDAFDLQWKCSYFTKSG